MNKKRFGCLALVLIMCAMALTGCTKADSARHDDVYMLFQTSVKSELYVDINNVGSAIISGSNSDNYYFEFTPDNIELRQKINSTEKNEFSVLANNKEYGYLLSHASKYFFNKFNDRAMLVYSYDKLKSISQSRLTTLYYQVEDTVNNIKEFGKDYRKLSNSYNELDPESKSTKFALEELINQYKSLIGSVLKMNMTTELIIDVDLFDYANSETEVSSLEVNRLVDAFELYTTYFLFQKYMLLTKNIQVEFLDSNLVAKINQVMQLNEQSKTNPNFKCSKVNQYEYLKLIEKDVRNMLQINENSLNILKGEVPSSNDAYKLELYNSISNYEQTLINYLDKIISLFN